MTNKKGIKRSLLMSGLALLLCVSMLIGSTFAWFTDSVTSAGNIIKSGTLDISMKWADGKEEPASANWQDASTTKIFNYDKWEPGYTEARHIAVKNEGTLALKYQLTIVPTGEVSKLAEVIDVYYINPAEQLGERADLSAYTPVGTLADLIDNGLGLDKIPSGSLVAGESFTATLVLKMQESAGNEYQNLSIGTDFSVRLLATQLTKENDSYGPDYDEDAWVDGFKVFNANDLQTAIDNGETNISLQNDIVLDTPVVIPAAASTYSLRATPVYTVINLNGKSITTANPATTYALNNLGNLIIVDTVGKGSINARGIYNGYGNGGENVTAANLIIENGIFNAMGTDGGAAIFNYGTVEIKSGTFTSNGGYGLNNRGVMIVKNANVKGGIYNIGDLTVTNSTVYQHLSGRHAIYNWEGSVVVNGGNFDSISGNELILADGQDASVVLNGGTYNKTGKSWLFGAATGKNIPITVYGGTFNFDPTKWVAEGFKVVNSAAGYQVVADSVDSVVTNAAELAEAIAKGGVVFIATDIDMNNAWTSVVPANGLTILGNNHTITNLNQPLLAGKGGPVVTVKGLTIADSNVGIAANENGLGTGAFMAFADHSGTVVFEDCHLLNSTVTGNERAAAFVAYSYANLTIKDCSVEGCTIEAVGSTAGLAAHVNGNTVIENSSVKNTKVTATEDRTGKTAVAGAVVGTINNNTAFTNVTASNNTVSNTGATPACEEVGRIVSGVWTVDGAVIASTAATLNTALTNGQNVILTADAVTNVTTTAPYGNKVAFVQNGGTLDGNGNKVGLTGGGDNYVIMTTGGTVKNITIEQGCRAVMIMYPTDDVIIDNANIGGDGVLYPINTGEKGADGVNLIVTNSTLAGWTSFSNIESASFTGVKFEQGTYYGDSIYGRVLKPYVNTTITNCSFIEHMNLDLSGLENGHKVTFTNCTVNNIAVTLDVFSVAESDADYDTKLFSVDLPSWATSVADCIVIG